MGLAPDFHDHGAERIAGQRIGRRAQRGLHIGRANAHHQARIEPEFAKTAHRQHAGFQFGKILPHPQQRPPRAEASHQAGDKAGRRRTLPSLGEYFVHRAPRQAALQRRIRSPKA